MWSELCGLCIDSVCACVRAHVRVQKVARPTWCLLKTHTKVGTTMELDTASFLRFTDILTTTSNCIR
jgi:hypothetical protein